MRGREEERMGRNENREREAKGAQGKRKGRIEERQKGKEEAGK